jgi:hypothetical protein
MTGLYAFLLAAAWPIAKKVLLALGIGYATYTGLSLIADQVKNEIISAWGQLGSASLQVLTLGGVPQSLGIILGALTAGAALMAAAKLSKVL